MSDWVYRNGNDMGPALDDRNEMICKPNQHWGEQWTSDVREDA
jgi:hypothetical protein